MTRPRIQPMLTRRSKARHLASVNDLCPQCHSCFSLCGLLMDYEATEKARILDRQLPDCKTCAKALA